VAFKFGFQKLAEDMKWLGRRYFSGLLHGVAICWLCYGLFVRTGPLTVAGELSYVCPFVLILIGFFVTGKRPKSSERESTESRTDNPRIETDAATPSKGDASENE
jgi:drug/metabolite transporter (DMT)-like permease